MAKTAGSDIAFFVDTAGSWEGRFPPVGVGDWIVDIKCSDGDEASVVVSRRYTSAPDRETAKELALSAYAEGRGLPTDDDGLPSGETCKADVFKVSKGGNLTYYSGKHGAAEYDEIGQWYRLVEIDDGPSAGERFVQITDEDDDVLVGIADADGDIVDVGNVSWTVIGRRTHNFDRVAAGIEAERAAERAAERVAEGSAAEQVDEHGPLRTFWLLKGYDDAGPFASRAEAEAARSSLIAEGAQRQGISDAEFEEGMGFPGQRFLDVEPIEREIWVTTAEPSYDHGGNFQIDAEGDLRVMALDPERTWYQVNRYGSGMNFAAPYGSEAHHYYVEHPRGAERGGAKHFSGRAAEDGMFVNAAQVQRNVEV